MLWWQTCVIYQIYPRSFEDSNQDGVGDLVGIASKLDHLVDLGIDALWISPIFPSPMADFGYDVSNYRDIDPVFGTLEDFDRVVAESHSRGLKVILDFVPNHTSDQHPWFLAACSSRRSPKRDWYIWRDGAPEGRSPNNWISEFGGSAWSFDETTGQYYYHAFLSEQPDLNWRNDDVRTAMLDVMRFWFDRGVDGFRVDAIHHLFEDELFRDDPPNPDFEDGMPPVKSLLREHTLDQPEVQDIVRRMRQIADGYEGDRVLIGEAYLPIDRLVAYYGTDLKGFHLPFNFHLLLAKWQAQDILSLITAYERALPSDAWPNWVLGNHDQSRLASRIGSAQARVAAMMLLTLRGTPTVYQGEEIGIVDVPIDPRDVQDPFEKNVPGQGLGRDPERTPMQWSNAPNAGFSTAMPWLPIASDFAERNVAKQRSDPASMLMLDRALIALRKRTPALAFGRYGQMTVQDNVLMFQRIAESHCWWIALNLDGEPKRVEGIPASAEVCLSTYLDAPDAFIGNALHLRADEGMMVRLAADLITGPEPHRPE